MNRVSLSPVGCKAGRVGHYRAARTAMSAMVEREPLCRNTDTALGRATITRERASYKGYRDAVPQTPLER